MIIGKRVRLRAVETSDLPSFVKWLNDPEVIEGLLFNMPLSQWEEVRWFEKLADHSPAERPLAIEILEGDNWRMVGNCEFHNISQVNRSAEVGIVIGEKSTWNSGFGTEAMQLMLKHGFETLNLNRIYLIVYEDNPRAIRSYEKAGFVREGNMRQAKYKHGKYIDELVMSVLRSEWDATQRKEKL